jgi:hypothetical protein
MITYKPLPIPDLEIAQYHSNLSFDRSDVQAFKDLYVRWITSGQNTTVLGLERFATALTDGVTGAFADFTHAYPDKELVVFKGEYPYHRDTGATVITNIDQLENGQRLILSVPFAASGNKPLQYEEIIERCNELQIPVFLDMAYFGAAKLGSILVDYECVKFVAFSLSKTFATGKCRIGICFYRDITVGPMQLLNQYEYVNHVSINMHYQILENFTPDYLFNKYRERQLNIANDLDIDASDTVFLCTTYDKKYNGFSRAGTINRIGIAEMLVNNYNVDEIKWHTKP